MTKEATHSDLEPIERLAYRTDKLVRAIGVSRSTVERRIADGTLKTTKVLGVRLIEAASVKALFEPRE